MTSPAPAPAGGPLRPVELATAGVMGGVTVVLAVVGVVVPIAAILQVLAAVPMGVVARRHRPRALVAAGVCGCVVGFLVAGTAPVATIALAALVGGIVGEVKRRGRGFLVATGAFALVAPLLAAMAVVSLLVFANLRELALETIRNTVTGVTALLGGVPGTGGLTTEVGRVTDLLVESWWWTIGGAVTLSVVLTGAVAWLALGAVLDRLDTLTLTDRLERVDTTGVAPAPTPVRLHRAGLRYPGATRDALREVELDLPRAELVAVVGHNGSGKSTVVRLLAGTPPTSGQVLRDGPPGLGRPGGTALVSQRPESQVLGARVADDVVWGLPVDTEPDVEALLAEVGLAGHGAQATTTLSGGQLQRLAIAAALARSPRLLLSDESTAMVDPAGRAELVALLAALPRRWGTTVVHVTHRAADAEVADRVVSVHDGTLTELQRDPSSVARPAVDPVALPPPGPPLLELTGVGHVYSARTPWAHRALSGVDLQVGRGEAVLLVGGNGSGKSTLAWVLGGLVRPTEGTAMLRGRPIAEQVGSVAVAFQHARLQLQRPTVGEDVAAAGRLSSGGHPAVAQVLRTVGLDPALAAAGTDSLSGGQLRRVALAGLLVTRPQVLVLDEPLAGLDAESRAGLAQVLVRLRTEQGLTLVVVTHDVAELAPICHRVVRLVGGRVAGDEPVAQVVRA